MKEWKVERVRVAVLQDDGSQVCVCARACTYVYVCMYMCTCTLAVFQDPAMVCGALQTRL